MRANDDERDTEKTERVFGLSAAHAAFRQRPESVISIAHTAAARFPISEMLRQAAKLHIAYREVPDDELARMADTVHHEGVCLLMRPRPAPGPQRIIELVGQQGLVLALDSVQNPHNVGAMLRTAAYFGASAMLVTGDEDKPALTPSGRRIAEGGAELVPLAQVPSLPNALLRLKEHDVTVIGADARAKLDVTQLRWPKRVVLVLGHERDGLGAETRQACDMLVRIGGTDAIDSLNVSVAAGILLASYSACHGLHRAT